MVSRKWLATLTSPEETFTQVETAFLAALEAEGPPELAGELATAALREAIASGYRDQVPGGQVPLLLRSATTVGRCARSRPGGHGRGGDRPAVRPARPG